MKTWNWISQEKFRMRFVKFRGISHEIYFSCQIPFIIIICRAGWVKKFVVRRDRDRRRRNLSSLIMIILNEIYRYIFLERFWTVFLSYLTYFRGLCFIFSITSSLWTLTLHSQLFEFFSFRTLRKSSWWRFFWWFFTFWWLAMKIGDLIFLGNFTFRHPNA